MLNYGPDEQKIASQLPEGDVELAQATQSNEAA
jgi:hypothetical protein